METLWHHEPYTWCNVKNWCTEEGFEEMLQRLPPTSAYRKYNDKYPERYLYDMRDRFWRTVEEYFYKTFGENIRVQLCHDLPGYNIGPHTDGKKEKSSYLFYLAKDSTKEHLGTSIYVPRETFTCDGTKHHEREKFFKLMTVPYLPNTGFGFIRSDNSFHGVEKTDSPRDVIQVSVWA